MKIVISGYVGKMITGIGRNLISLLNALQTDTEFVLYVNHDMAEEMVFSNPRVTVKTYPVSRYQSFQNLLWTTFVFPFKVLKERADRALIPNFTLLLLKFRPTMVIMPDLIEYNVPNKFSKLKMFYRTKLANPITSRMANRIITVSDYSKKDIIKFLGVKEEKISVVKCGVDPDQFQRMPKELAQQILSKRGWPQDFLLYVGTLDHPGKNAMSVIQAFEALKKSGKWHGALVLAGMPGSGFEAIQSHVDASAFREDLYITGYVTEEELIALYSACQVFCFCSLYEGFGIPPLEALACGARVVVSNTSSLPEAVSDLGFFVDPTSCDDIARGIERALRQPLSPEYAQRVKAHIANHRWENLAKEFDSVLCMG